jgi:hypothetical protein
VGTGRISIARGYERKQRVFDAPADRVTAQRLAQEVLGAQADPQNSKERISALERLANLHARGILSDEELAAEKRLVIGAAQDRAEMPSGPVSFVPGAGAAQRGPSLAGRMMNWRVLAAGLVAGGAICLVSEPNETARFLVAGWRLIAS